MNADEQKAEKYLKSLGRGNVTYEPDGNVPPDFSLANSIAVEVRRLSENYFEGGEPEALEELAIPLWKNLRQATTDLNNELSGETYWVRVEYERPSKETGKETVETVKGVLRNFFRSSRKPPQKERVNENLILKIKSSRNVKGEVFRMAAGRDLDSGGFVMNKYVKNIKYCIEEKSSKVEEHLEKYDEWWLLMIDHIGYGLLDTEENKLKSKMSDLGRFDRTLIIGSNLSGPILEIPDTKP